MGLPIYIVDAFAARPFAGNPAAVCILPEPRDDGWMQAVAREMNLSETAFLLAREDGWQLRWRTPAVEVDLCGHATLASAHVLWETGRLAQDHPARFHTRSGLLTAARRDDGIEMDFPAEPVGPVEPLHELTAALGFEPRFVGRNRLDYLVEAPDAHAVREARPDLALLASLPARGVIITARADAPAFDFVSRCFYPAAGVDEDPVTGSAHCALGPYWGPALGKSDMTAFQASARGGVVRVGVRGERVLLGGQASTIVRGELLH